MTTAGDPSTRAAPAAAKVLCVDDEPNILLTLRRLFRASGFVVRIADSGSAALDMLKDEPADVVISDMRMPFMNGAAFLEQVRIRWPETMRILLTGQADAAGLTEVINSGQIHRYIAKPWDDADIVAQVRQAADHKIREQERLRLQSLASSRNEELKALNASLAQDVNATKESLTSANERLKSNFVVSLKVFSSLIETRRKQMVGHARRVADLARKLAARLQLEPALVHEVFVAGLLHDVGKLAFTDELLDTPVASMNAQQLEQYRLHPTRAEELLMPLQDLRGAAASIAAQLERFDGTGYPRQLQGRAILVGARILAVCSDYDNLQIGVLAPRLLTAHEALGVIERSAGKRYDSWVLEAFSGLMRGKPVKVSVTTPQKGTQPVAAAEPAKAVNAVNVAEESDDMQVNADTLTVGMVLSRDLMSPSGLMMLPSGHAIDKRLTQKMLDFEKTDGVALTIFVRKPAEPD